MQLKLNQEEIEEAIRYYIEEKTNFSTNQKQIKIELYNQSESDNDLILEADIEISNKPKDLQDQKKVHEF